MVECRLFLLRGVGVEDRRKVLGAQVGTLTVGLRGIVDLEEELGHLLVGDPAGVVADLYGLQVANWEGADGVAYTLRFTVE